MEILKSFDPSARTVEAVILDGSSPGKKNRRGLNAFSCQLDSC
jgi:hypothetical protein